MAFLKFDYRGRVAEDTALRPTRSRTSSTPVRGGALTDWFVGGLNHRIEHHLFPSAPRPHLRLARPTVRAYCREMGIAYTERGRVDSYRQTLRHMYEVGAPLRGE